MQAFDSICILSTDYPSKDRPVYLFVEQLVCAMVEKGITVSVIAPQSLTKCLVRKIRVLPRHQSYATPGGMRYDVFRPYTVSFGMGHRRLYRLFRRYNQSALERCLERIRPHVVYGHFWANACRLRNYAITTQTPLFVACGEGNDALDRLGTSLSADERAFMRKTVCGVISVYTENRMKCIGYGLTLPKDVIVLPNAVDPNLFFPRERNTKLRESLGVTNADFLILFVGSFIRRKGCGILAQAVDRLNDPHIKVVFAGSVMPGEGTEPVCNGIVFKGIIAHEKLPDYYAAADAFVLPTLHEGCSNAIVEALAMGIPVISSFGRFNDDILNDKNSIRVNPTSVDELVASIGKLKNDQVLYQKIRSNMILTAGNYSIEKRADKILAFMNGQLIQNNKRQNTIETNSSSAKKTLKH